MKANLFMKQLLGALFFFVIIFICAGRFLYWQGLVYVGIGLIMIVLNYTVFRLDDELLQERSKPGEGVKKWDKIILGISFLATIGMYITAGFDSGRFHWSPDFHWSLILLGGFFTVLGQLLFLIAQKQNRFFSSIVRIQTDRGHRVCNTGLYSFVRHPAYLGSLIQTIGFPFLFCSLWSVIPVALLMIVSLIRTYLEDNTLKKELSGYAEYAQKTRYRILPFIW